MDNRNQKTIDNLFRNKLQNYELDHTDASWKLLKHLLNKKNYFIMKIIKLLFLFLVLSNFDVYAEFITLWCNGNTGSSQNYAVSPYNYSIKSRHVQIVYTKNEIYQAGGIAGNINAMQWMIYELTSGSLLNFEIKFGHTTASDASAHINTTFTTVFSSPSFNFSNTGWQTINFTNPFYWNGNDNIVIDICFGLNFGESNTGYILLCNTNLPNQMRGVGSSYLSACGTPTSLAVNGKPVVSLDMNISNCMPAQNIQFVAIGTIGSVIKWTNPSTNIPDKYLIQAYKTSTNSLVHNYIVENPINYNNIFVPGPETEFSVYISSICGTDTADPIGPFNFTTTS